MAKKMVVNRRHFSEFLDGSDEFAFSDSLNALEKAANPCYEDTDLEEPIEEFKRDTKNVVRKYFVPSIMKALGTASARDGLVIERVLDKTVAGLAVGIATACTTGGPTGIVISALITGSLMVYKMAKKNSIMEHLKKLTPRQKEDLIGRIAVAIRNHQVGDLATEILQNEEVKKIALSILSSFLTQRFGIQIVRDT